MELLKTFIDTISPVKNVTIHIEDTADVDMYFMFQMKSDPSDAKSYTHYDVQDNQHGIITIYNASKFKKIDSTNIQVGEYAHTYDLYMRYSMLQNGDDGSEYEITINFFIEKQDGNEHTETK